MAEIKKFPNEKAPVYGKCDCGCENFRLRLNSGDTTTVTHLECAECGDTAPLETDFDFGIECYLDDDA